MKQPARGFTLIEVLVALAVLAVSAAALIHQTQQSTRLQQQLELKSMALALAESELALIASESRWPPLGRRNRDISLETLEWQVESEVQATPSAALRRVDVRVRPAQQEEGHTVALTTYMGRN